MASSSGSSIPGHLIDTGAARDIFGPQNHHSEQLSNAQGFRQKGRESRPTPQNEKSSFNPSVSRDKSEVILLVFNRRLQGFAKSSPSSSSSASSSSSSRSVPSTSSRNTANNPTSNNKDFTYGEESNSANSMIAVVNLDEVSQLGFS
ncbi:unnamed protein product [Protopolystoma xenopodis]|uniref:Uncharacterized protein n=1 Tax=Protopolystoma xenopodis TaxID=117903 RepID=A0A448WPU7_9PLAT|nr:unnamed protein product [Protopolystoma xenopodis]